MHAKLLARARIRPMVAFAAIAALLTGGAIAALAPATAAQAAPISALAGNAGFTVVTEGNTTFDSTSETEGSWAVGGNLTQQGSKYTIIGGAYQPTASLPVVESKATRLLVNGSVTLAPGSNQERLNVNPGDGYGNVTIGSPAPAYAVNTSGEIRDATGAYMKTASPAAASTPYPTSATAFASVFGTSTFSNYRALSSALLTLSGATVATPTITLGPLNGSPLSANDVGITLTANKINIWSPTSSQWDAIQDKSFKFYNSATINSTTPLIINVPASKTSLVNPNWAGAPSDVAKYVLWNVNQGGAFELGGSKLLEGSVLAPNADLKFNKGTPAEGQFVAKTANVTGNAELHHVPFVPELTPPPPADKFEVALYLYRLKDSTAEASWPNSLKQTFIASKTGTDWFTTYPGNLPEEVCGDGWGVQQDKVKNWAYDGAFAWPSTITAPDDNIGWPPIYEAKHVKLSELITVPACDTPTGEPTLEVKTCESTTRNWATLPAVTGGTWQIEKDGVTTEVASFDGAPASGFGSYAIRLIDADPNDKNVVAPKSWTWVPVDPATLPCAYAADPVWVDQKCNPTGPGTTIASYGVVAAPGVRYELSTNDGAFDDVDPATYAVSTFPTKITIRAFPLSGFTLVGTSEFSHVFTAAGDCIDKDASATIATAPPTCTAPGSIDLAASVLVNATWTTSPMPTTAGPHTVVATANPGHAFASGLTTESVPVTIPAIGAGLNCPTIVTPTATFTQFTCTTAGSYTLGPAAGVKFTVNSTSAKTGTTQVTGSGKVEVSALPDAPSYDFPQGTTTPVTWSFTFVKPSAADCGGGTTLASTGSSIAGGAGIIAGLLLLAGVGFIIARKRIASE